MKRMVSTVVLLMLLSVQISILAGSSEGEYSDKILKEGPSRGPAYIEEDGTLLKIGNDHIELVLDKNTNCGITEIIDRSTGEDLRGNKVPPPVIFMLMYWTGNATDIVIQWDAESISIDKGVGTGYATLTIDYFRFRGNNLNATVTIDVQRDQKYLRMRMDIENDEDFIVRSLFFPVVWGVDGIGASEEDDKVFYPVGDGLILNNPLSYKDDLHMAEMYPSTASMQMMCYYDENETGFYMTSDDDQGHPKKPTFDSMEWSTISHVTMFFENLIPESTGNDYLMPYECRIGTFKGDWYDAAEVYKEWSLTTDLIGAGKVFEDKDTPHWWSNTSVISSSNRDAHIVHNSLSDIEKMTEEFNELTGVNTTHLIFAWAEKGAWCGPYYFPPAAGEENFVNSMNNISEMGSHAILYISGSVWRITRDDIGYADYETFNDIGKKWACIDQTGNPTIDPGYLAINWTSARMCPMTDFWQEMVVNNTLGCIDLGVDVVQIDEFPIGSVYPCYNASHGHAIGYSNDITASYRSILETARTEGRQKNTDLIMSMEEPCEYYIPYMDTYVSRDNSPEFMIYPIAVDLYGDDVEFVPFFSYVYHEYITAFAEPIPMNYDYPELFIDQMKRSIARGFISGEIISGSADEKENLRPEVLDLYNTTVRASTSYCNDYMIKGEPLRPPEIDVPDEQVDWYFYSDQKIGRTFNESSVLHSSWRSDENNIGHVFLNWIDEDVEFDVTLPEYDIAGDYSIMITRNGEREVLDRSTSLPYSFTLETSPGEVVLVEIIRTPDLAVDGFDIGSTGSPLFTNDTYPVEFGVWNQGSDLVDDFTIDLKIDGRTVASSIGSELRPGAVLVSTLTLNTTDLIGQYNVSLVFDGEDDIDELDESNNLDWQMIEILERPRANLEVVVNDSRTGGPLENVSIRIHSQDNGYNITSYTDEFGTIFLDRLIAGTYSINCSKDHYWSNETIITISEGEERIEYIELEWREYPFISGIVVDNGTGLPIEGARVKLYSEDSPMIPIGVEISTDNGIFIFTELIAGLNYSLEIATSGYYHNSTYFLLKESIIDLEIRLRKIPPAPVGWINGTVLDNDTGEPIPDVYVKLNQTKFFRYTDENGQFNFTDVRTGINILKFNLNGYKGTKLELEVFKDLATDVTIYLIKSEETEPEPLPERFDIRGRLTDQKGVSIENAVILLTELNLTTETDSYGYFSFINITQGNYTLKISADGFEDLEITVSDSNPSILIEMTPEKKEDEDNKVPMALIVFAILSTVLLLIIISYLFMRNPGVAGLEE